MVSVTRLVRTIDKQRWRLTGIRCAGQKKKKKKTDKKKN